jgi:DNA polymerase III subunit delta
VLNVARYDIDDLRDALLAGDLARYCRTLDGLRQEGEPSLLALWAVTEEIRALAQIRAGIDRGQSVDALLRDAKVWGPRVGPVKRAVQKYATPLLRELLRETALIDRQIKGAAIGDPWEQLLHLGCRLLGGHSGRRRSA